MHTRHLLFATTALVAAIPAAAQAADARYAIDLPAGPLDSVLIQAAQQTNVQLVFTDPSITQIRARRISGSFTARQLLDLLLSRTGYTYRFTGPRSVRVMPLVENGAKDRPAALTVTTPQVADGQTQPAAPAAAAEAQDATGVEDQTQPDIVAEHGDLGARHTGA